VIGGTAVFGDLRRRLAQRNRDWLKKRQGPDGLSVTLHRRRIYILPTKAGLMYGAVVFLLLLGSLNYANNMGFVLTFLLAAIGLVAMHHCHNNLSDVTLTFVAAEPVFAGQDAQFEFVMDSHGSRWQLELGWDRGTEVTVDAEGNERVRIRLPLPTKRRGWIPCTRIGISTSYPLGLFRAWAWVYMDLHALVYPQPVATQAQLAPASPDREQQGLRGLGDDEFSELREYRRGDSIKHIAWKSAASHGRLLVKEYREGGQMPLWLDWNHVAAADTEARLSALTRLALDADKNQNVYGLRIPGAVVPPSRGKQHLHHCLRELAVFGTGGKPE